MCRLAVYFRRPLHEVAKWDAAEIRLLQAFIAREPPAEERLDIAIAGLRCLLSNYLRPAGRAPFRLLDFLPFHDPWKPAPVAADERYSDLDREIISALGD